MKNRPHELYKIVIEFAGTVEADKHITRYVFGTDHLPAAREAAIADCGIWPCYVTIYEWTGKRWWSIDRKSVNGGVMWYDYKKENQLPF